MLTSDFREYHVQGGGRVAEDEGVLGYYSSATTRTQVHRHAVTAALQARDT
jgi:hypothetical protein